MAVKSIVAALILLWLIAAIATASEPASAPTTRPSRLAFRFVASSTKFDDPDIEMLPDPASSEHKLLSVRRGVLLDESDVAAVRPVVDPKSHDHRIDLDLTDEGARKMERITRENIRRRLAIVLDGKLLMAPTISGVITHTIDIAFSPFQSPQTRADALAALRTAVPATQPATRPVKAADTTPASQPNGR
jgi:preprotein translocase subunit SecD